MDKGFCAYEFMATYCPFMAPLRGMPEFGRVLAKAKGRWEEFARVVGDVSR